MKLDLSPGLYLGYAIYLVYIGFYVYNRLRGKSAQFFIKTGSSRVTLER